MIELTKREKQILCCLNAEIREAEKECSIAQAKYDRLVYEHLENSQNVAKVSLALAVAKLNGLKIIRRKIREILKE